eukprot:COSAG06_NODE_60554_length_270_cov_0.912281_1_plen_31_part_10
MERRRRVERLVEWRLIIIICCCCQQRLVQII